MNLKARSLLLGSVLIVLVAGSPALATFDYANDPFGAVNFSFDDVSETTQTGGDAEPLYGDNGANEPTTVGDALVFTPLAAFSASSSAGSGTDVTTSNLQVDIVANALTIDTITITESGSYDLSGGGVATGVFVLLGGTLTVLEANGVPLGGGAQVFSFGVDTPATPFFFLSGNGGDQADTWSLEYVIDVTSLVPDATLVRLAWNNQIQASSEASSSADIDKQSLTISLPEPSTFGLMIFGLLGATFRGHRSRRCP